MIRSLSLSILTTLLIYGPTTVRAQETCALWPIMQTSPTTWLYAAEYRNAGCNAPQSATLNGLYSWPETCGHFNANCESSAEVNKGTPFMGLPDYVPLTHHPIFDDPKTEQGTPSGIAREHSQLFGKTIYVKATVNDTVKYFLCHQIKLQLKGSNTKEIRIGKQLASKPEGETVHEIDPNTELKKDPNSDFAYEGTFKNERYLLLLIK